MYFYRKKITMRLLLSLVLLCCCMTAFALDKPGCCQVCWQGQACENTCISKDDVCSIPLGWGCACDKDYIISELATKEKCCKHHTGACGCAGGRVLCCDATLSDKCGCQFIMEHKNP